MLIRIGGYNRYDDYESFSLDSEPDFYIAERPVIDDELPKIDKVNAMVASHVPDEGIWSELGFSQEVIGNWKKLQAVQKVIDMATNPATQGAQLAQLPANVPDTPPSGNAPAIKGAKLPSDQAVKVNPITPDELAAVGAMHRSSKQVAA
jgi:hypothetical protein